MGKRRRSVVALPMMLMHRKTPETLGGGHWGAIAKRFPGKTRAYSPRLLSYRMCIAGKLKGTKHDSIGAVQAAFTRAAEECKKEAESKPTIKKTRYQTYI